MQESVLRRRKISGDGDGQAAVKRGSRSVSTRWTWAALALGLVTLGGAVAGHDAPYGIGKWIDATRAPNLCGPAADRLCAEFEDGLGPDSPHHGKFCCVKASEIELGLYVSCLKKLGRNPRGD